MLEDFTFSLQRGRMSENVWNCINVKQGVFKEVLFKPSCSVQNFKTISVLFSVGPWRRLFHRPGDCSRNFDPVQPPSLQSRWEHPPHCEQPSGLHHSIREREILFVLQWCRSVKLINSIHIKIIRYFLIKHRNLQMCKCKISEKVKSVYFLWLEPIWFLLKCQSVAQY